MELLGKRLGILVISLTIGYAVTYAIMEPCLDFIPLIGWCIDTSLQEYGGMYTFFTVLSIAGVPAIWLDKFLGAGILSE